MLVKLYNMRVKGYTMAAMGVFKRVAYWVKMEGSVPDPSRVKLETFRVLPSDSHFMLFRRLLYTICVVAGFQVQPGTRDDGAGDTAKYKAQWCHSDCVEDLTFCRSSTRPGTRCPTSRWARS